MDRALYHEMAALEDRHWWFEARREILRVMLDRLPLPDPAEVLEVGCGTGGNLALLAAYGHLFACEPDDEARTLAAERGLAQVAPGTLPDALPFGTQPFDLIALLDVLEHVEADRDSLRALHARLKPGGFLLLTVPAYRCLWSPHDEANHHVRRYVRREVVEKVRAVGFRLRYATYFNTLLFPVVAAVRLLGKLRPHEGSDLSMPAAPLNRLLRRTFASERRILPHAPLPFGVSILAIAEKTKP